MRDEPRQRDNKPGAASFWAPFEHTTFRVVWSAVLVGNTATAMRELAATWLMTSLAPSAFAVGMVKAAAALPILLLALPAGALADRLDRRAIAVSVNLLLAIIVAGVGLAIIADAVTPWLLVTTVFIAGIGSAILQPIDQSLVPLSVDAELLEPAIALNGMALNVARAVGPALAGLLVAGAGMALAFFANSLGYILVMASFVWWKGASVRADGAGAAREKFSAALVAGLRFAWTTPKFLRVLWQAGWFVLVASAYWTLLPVLVRRDLDGSAGLYGVLLAGIGGGTILTTFTLPLLRKWLAPGAAFRLGAGATVVALALFAWVDDAYAATAVAVLAGAAWLVALTVANVAAQEQLDDAMRGRGMALYLMVFGGAMTIGSLFWATLADHASVRLALGLASASGLVGLVFGWRRPLPDA